MSNKKKPICSICKAELIPKDFNRYILQCHQCHHTYYTSVWDSNYNVEDSDIELEASTIESNDGPSLIASSHGMDSFPSLSSTIKEDPYEQVLKKRYGGHVDVTIKTESSW